ncbi:MAG TPA: hypothetical protein VGL86_01265 [Polyangia bacterium]
MDPYRSEPTEAQFVCVVCWRSLSVYAGECARCGVDRLSLADPEVRAEARAEAEKRIQKRLYGEWFWLYLVGFFAATPVSWLVIDRLQAMALWVVSALVIGSASVKVYEKLNPRSILRLYADRRRRLELATAGGAAQKLLPARADDPEDAELSRVLALLGARVEDKA